MGVSVGGCLCPEGFLSGVSIRETPSPRGQTDTSENITLPQTSFAGVNKAIMSLRTDLISSPTSMKRSCFPSSVSYCQTHSCSPSSLNKHVKDKSHRKLNNFGNNVEVPYMDQCADISVLDSSGYFSKILLLRFKGDYIH